MGMEKEETVPKAFFYGASFWRKCVMVCPWCGSYKIKKYLYYPENSFDLNICKICKNVFPGPENGSINYKHYNKIDSYERLYTSDRVEDVFYNQKAESNYLVGRTRKAIDHIKIKRDEYFSLLDIGAGPGLLLSEIRKRYPNAVLKGIEPSIHNVNIAKKNNNIDLICGYWEGVRKEKYDIVTIFGSLMLHPDPRKSLLLAKDCLKPGGILLFDFKNPISATRFFLRKFAKYFPGSMKRKLFRQGFHGMPWGLAKNAVSELLENADLKIISIEQLPGRNVDFGEKISPLFRCSYLLDRLFNAQSWIEFMAQRKV